MDNNTWQNQIIPTYIQYLAGQDIKEMWTINNNDSIMILQTIWNFIYGAKVPHTIKLNSPAFYIVSVFFILFPMLTVLLHRLTSTYVNGRLELDPLPLPLSRHTLKIMTRSTIPATPVKILLLTSSSNMDFSMGALRKNVKI